MPVLRVCGEKADRSFLRAAYSLQGRWLGLTCSFPRYLEPGEVGQEPLWVGDNTAEVPDRPLQNTTLLPYRMLLVPHANCTAWEFRLAHRLTFVLHAIISLCLAWVGWSDGWMYNLQGKNSLLIHLDRLVRPWGHSCKGSD